MKIAAAIPAKGTSNRVPSKNMQQILGVPLFLWAANNLNRVLPKEDIYIDSDSDETLALAEKFGYQTIKRPSDLATNATDGNQLMLWQASNLDADIIIQHLPPMIFLKAETIRKALSAIRDDGYDSAFAINEEAFYLWDENGARYDLKNIPNSFTLPKLRIEGMGFYACRKEKLVETGVRVCGRSASIEIDAFESVDIDNPIDLEMARAIAGGLSRDSKYTAGLSQYFSRPNIKLLVLDVDGVMTDGGMYYTESGDQFKKFDTKDGIAIKRMVESGIEVRFLSSGTNVGLIKNRAETLGVQVAHCGLEKKTEILGRWIEELSLKKEDIAYIGDDINDLEAMKMSGFTVCPSDAVVEIKSSVNVVLTSDGGASCVREFWETYIKE